MSPASQQSTFFKKTLLSAACGLLCAANAFAQSNAAATTLAPVTVTAKRSEQPVTDALADVSVIDRETIAQAGSASLVELLQSQHGIEYSSNGGAQTTGSIFTRGANANHTLVLLDGMRISSSTLGSASLEALPIDSLERVEILRGPASGLYGADAIGGVINLITRKGEGSPFQPYASIGYGSWNTFKANVGVSGSTDMWNYAVNLGRTKSDGYNATTPSSTYFSPDKDGYTLDHGSAQVGLTWAKDQSLQANFYASNLDGQYDGYTKTFDYHTLKQVQALSIASNNRITDFWNSRLRIGQTKDHAEDVSDYPSVFETIQTQYSWQNDFNLAKGHQASLALERLVEEVTVPSSSYATPPEARKTNSVTAVYQGDMGMHHVLLNGRLDHSNQYGNKTTGGLTYGLEVVKGLRFTVGGSTGFRAPTFNDLYYNDGFGSQGNPNLKPESSRNLEIGVRYQDSRTQASLNAYRNKVTNLIDWKGSYCNPPDPYSSCSANVNQATLEGLSVSAAHRFATQAWGTTSLKASADWQYPHDDATGQLLARRARAHGKLSAEHRYAGILFGVETQFVGKRVDYDYYGTAKPMGGYSLVNLLASYDLSRNWTVQGRWNNVANKSYELAPGYATPGSNVFFTLSYRN